MTTTAKIGAFFLAALVLAGFLILKIEQLPLKGKKSDNTLDVTFKDVAGLDDKSPVRIAGVRIGKVDGIKLRPDGTAIVHLLLDPDVEVRTGATGEIKSLGLLGDKYVEIHPGTPGAPRLPKDTVIAGGQPTSMDDLTKLASDIGKDVKELTGAFAGSLGGARGEEKINRIVDNLGKLSESLAALVEQNRANVGATMANLKEFSAEIRETLARVDRIIDENRVSVKGTVTNIDQITDKLKTTADNLNSITAKLDRGEGTMGKLLNDDETHKSINEALQSVKSGVETFTGTLSKINKLDINLGFGGEYLTRDKAAREHFRLDVYPNPNKLYRVELIALPNGKRSNVVYNTTFNTGGVTSTTTTSVETREDTLVVSAELGYRFGNTFLRGGMIESRGGVGIDQFFLKDKLQLTAEAFDFSKFRTDQGHVRLFGQWNLDKNLYVSAGVDEVLNSSVRSVFLGGGIRWKDDDIRSLLGALPLLK